MRLDACFPLQSTMRERGHFSGINCQKGGPRAGHLKELCKAKWCLRVVFFPLYVQIASVLARILGCRGNRGDALGDSTLRSRHDEAATSKDGNRLLGLDH